MSVVGALACQRNSYLHSLLTKVISCHKVKNQYEVETADTVLFPEGGGQPTDYGCFIVDGKKIDVKEVKRQGIHAVHVLEEPLDEGTEVEMEVDWARRFDHMQQHTGQHLLSAVLDQRDLNTLGWNLGEMINYIELPRKLTTEELQDVSKEVNDYITESIPISVEVPDKDSVKKDKMPTDLDLDKGVLRVIHIGDLDANPCCGTHLCSTAHIKGIALLNQINAKGGHSRLNFLAGDRIIKYASESHALIKSLMATMGCQSETLNEKAATLTKETKKLQSRQTSLMKELADLKALEISQVLQKQDFTYVHRTDGDLPYISHIFKQLNPLPEGKTVALLTGDNHESGAIIVFGSDVADTVAGLKERLSTLKGGGKGKFQGKIGSYEKGELDKVLKFLDSKASPGPTTPPSEAE